MTNEYISPEVERFLNRLHGVRKNGNNWSARCPCRSDDQNPSLSIGQGNDGRVLVTCHRGIPCDVDQICQSVGLTVPDLMPKKQEPVRQKLTLVETYPYRDRYGTLLFEKQRFIDQDGKKTFRQRRVDPETGEWVANLDGIEKVLYNLPMVCSARDNGQEIWLVEGEKDANTLIEMGLAATTMPGGAGKWLDIHTDALAGATVTIIADNDDVGKKHALMVADKLRNASCTVGIKICDGVKDITDHINAGKSITDLKEFDPELDTPEPEPDPFSGVLTKLEQLFAKDNLSQQTKLARAELIIREIDNQSGGVRNEGRLVDWETFVKESDKDNYDWVIPNLLERGERVIVVAAEGVGKTMLARQVALCCSAGLHPFTFEAMPPVRTLMVDLENPERIIRRTSRNIYNATLHYGNKEVPDAHLLIKPDGIDLMKSSDRFALEEKIEAVRPDIIFLGPVYKSFIDPGGRTSESIAIEIAKYFDTLREYFKCAMWFEHHAPLGNALASRDLRPFGSAVWSRWPEFGLSLQPDPTAMEGYVYEVRHFRGARDQRKWPTKMKRGKVFPFEVLQFLENSDER